MKRTNFGQLIAACNSDQDYENMARELRKLLYRNQFSLMHEIQMNISAAIGMAEKLRRNFEESNRRISKNVDGKQPDITSSGSKHDEGKSCEIDHSSKSTGKPPSDLQADSKPNYSSLADDKKTSKSTAPKVAESRINTDHAKAKDGRSEGGKAGVSSADTADASRPDAPDVSSPESSKADGMNANGDAVKPSEEDPKDTKAQTTRRSELTAKTLRVVILTTVACILEHHIEDAYEEEFDPAGGRADDPESAARMLKALHSITDLAPSAPSPCDISQRSRSECNNHRAMRSGQARSSNEVAGAARMLASLSKSMQAYI